MAGRASEYQRKRNFDITSEPRDDVEQRVHREDPNALIFVVQKHHASRLHYDFRLELNGTLKSWAVPKGPSLDPEVKRLAVHVEDHPLNYASFEGDIPKGEYGAGHVIVWDQGTWKPEEDPEKAYRRGKLTFSLSGEKLSGTWNLIRTRFKDSKQDQWLLIKDDDEAARPTSDYDIVEAEPGSVKTSDPGNGQTRGNGRQKTPESKASVAKTAAPKARLPASLKPQLATLVTRPPIGNWLYEIKFDGYRLLTRISDGKVKLLTRNGHDWTSKLPAQAEALRKLPIDNSWLDGEMVVLDKDGLPDFQALQNALDHKLSQRIVYYLFDAPFLSGRDLRDQPLDARRQALEKIMADNPQDLLRFSETFASASYKNIYDSACSMSLEGVIGKRADSVYRSGRSADWIKLKCLLRQEFVIIGYTEPKGSREGFGALLLGVHTEPGSKEIAYCGKVGTGFNNRKLKEIAGQLGKLQRKTRPALVHTEELPAARDIHWVRPALVCEVEFSQWTRANIIRHAVFVSLRDDKPASDIIREKPATAKDIASKTASTSDTGSNRKTAHTGNTDKIASIAISSPERVIDKDSGTRKVELAAFYASIAEWLLPHMQARPVSLLRAPSGIAGQQFFQKHAENLSIPNIKHLDPALDPGHDRLMEIDSLKALVGSVQMGTVEYHTWNATTDRIEHPDRLVLDLDPDPELPWQAMLDATRLLLAVLDELDLDVYLKTSGGKGMHVVIPLARHLDWDEGKSFAKGISLFMARQLPDHFASKMGPKNRINKIFIDYLRNSRGASTVAAYSVRARPGLPVSVPIRRDELDSLDSAAQWHIGNLWSRLESLQAAGDDPWQGYNNRQRITKHMWHQLELKPPRR